MSKLPKFPSNDEQINGFKSRKNLEHKDENWDKIYHKPWKNWDEP